MRKTGDFPKLIHYDPLPIHRIVLNLVRTRQPISRADLPRTIGLGRGAVTLRRRGPLSDASTRLSGYSIVAATLAGGDSR